MLIKLAVIEKTIGKNWLHKRQQTLLIFNVFNLISLVTQARLIQKFSVGI